jgi:hypothetical protein
MKGSGEKEEKGKEENADSEKPLLTLNEKNEPLWYRVPYNSLTMNRSDCT